MQHLNPYMFYDIAARLHGLFSGSAQYRVTDMFRPLADAQAVLDALIKGDPLSLNTSRNDAVRLLEKISALFDRYYIDETTRQLRQPTGEDRIDQHEMAMLYAMLEKFEHALAAELSHSPTYTAGKCGIYSISDLAENAHLNLAPSVCEAVSPGALQEIDIAGRAMVFGLGTAAVMHLLRAVEIVLKQYYEAFVGTQTARNERSYTLYIKKLAALAEDESVRLRPDRRLLQMLAQIKEHYRNPLISPDSTATVEQALSLFGLTGAIITMMTEQMATAEPPRSRRASTNNNVIAVENDDNSEELGEETTNSISRSSSKKSSPPDLLEAESVDDADGTENYEFRPVRAVG